MIYELPPQHDGDYIQFPQYDYTLELDGDEYRFSLRWMERLEAWFLSLYESDGQALLINVKMSVNASFARSAVGRRLMLVDTTGQDNEATFLSLGKSHKLMWMDQDDLDYVDSMLAVSYSVYAPSGEKVQI